MTGMLERQGQVEQAALIPGGIFWRTFFLIALLISVSLGAWFQSFRILEREPRARQTAQTLVSVVNVTRAALIHSDPTKRRALLVDLARNEGIRIYPQENSDRVEPLRDSDFLNLVKTAVRDKLGPTTQFSLNVNGQDGLWVDFAIEEDGYWVAFDGDRVDITSPLGWLGWAGIALLLSLLGAVLISRLINLPLKRLTAAALSLGRGEQPAPLPEQGPREIREANATFNAMVAQLARIDSDRALLLAGISHDLRTPLTRLRLEVEMSAPDDATRAAMSADVEQMDAVIGQFLDYARPAADDAHFEDLDLGNLIRQKFPDLNTTHGVTIRLDLHAAALIHGHATELKRLLDNLVENARRYAQPANGDPAEVTIAVHAAHRNIILEVRDNGTGVPAEQLERLKQPFTRMDTARSQANGAGLGLAIAARIAERHRARFELLSPPGSGLIARFVFPGVKRRK